MPLEWIIGIVATILGVGYGLFHKERSQRIKAEQRAQRALIEAESERYQRKIEKGIQKSKKTRREYEDAKKDFNTFASGVSVRGSNADRVSVGPRSGRPKQVGRRKDSKPK